MYSAEEALAEIVLFDESITLTVIIPLEVNPHSFCGKSPWVLG
jgi:hypothetical protein